MCVFLICPAVHYIPATCPVPLIFQVLPYKTLKKLTSNFFDKIKTEISMYLPISRNRVVHFLIFNPPPTPPPRFYVL